MSSSSSLAGLNITRASKQFVYSGDGREYFDCVTHVAQVGHSHPAVIAAACNQFKKLTSAAGFLNDENSKYIKELVETFPHELSVCFLVNSESEANDLALRLARLHTKCEDVFVIDESYHGTCGTLMEISPLSSKSLSEFVHVLPLPIDHEDYITVVNNIVKAALLKERHIACFITELVMQLPGMVILPEDYVKEIFRIMHSIDGVCIINESLTGLGRCGESLWSFQAFGLHPDIVTVGNILGNGYPMAAVLTTPIIASALEEYRNTVCTTIGSEGLVNSNIGCNQYGGNPVACAIGNAVLSIIQNEKLVSSSKCVGMFLMNGLSELQCQFPMVKKIRGLGLCIGIELAIATNSNNPSAIQLMERLKEHNILVACCGKKKNVISITPPLCFTIDNSRQLLTSLRTILSETSGIKRKSEDSYKKDIDKTEKRAKKDI